MYTIHIIYYILKINLRITVLKLEITLRVTAAKYVFVCELQPSTYNTLRIQANLSDDLFDDF